MHDDIGAGLTQISLISNAAILRAKSGSDISNELSDIAGTSRQLVDNIGEIVWALNPQHGTLGNTVGTPKGTADQSAGICHDEKPYPVFRYSTICGTG